MPVRIGERQGVQRSGRVSTQPGLYGLIMCVGHSWEDTSFPQAWDGSRHQHLLGRLDHNPPHTRGYKVLAQSFWKRHRTVQTANVNILEYQEDGGQYQKEHWPGSPDIANILCSLGQTVCLYKTPIRNGCCVCVAAVSQAPS